MSRTSDLVVARLRMLGRRWDGLADTDSDQQPMASGDTGLDAPVPGPSAVPRAWLRLGLVVVVLSLAFAGWTLATSWPRSADVAHPGAQAGTDPAVGGAAGSEPDTLGPLEPLTEPAPSPALTVHVVGEVRRPGVVSVPAGSRVADVIAAAGGLRKGARLGATNLARPVADGERVDVGPGTEPPSGGPVGGSAPTGGSGLPGIIDLNSASAEQLDTLPGVGPVTAAKIIAWRTQNGRFTVVDELAEVPGIGPKTLEELRPLVRV